MLFVWCTCAKLYIYLWARQNKKTDDSFVALQSIANELANGEMPPQEFYKLKHCWAVLKWMEGLLEIEKNWEMLIPQDCANILLYNICTRENSRDSKRREGAIHYRSEEEGRDSELVARERLCQCQHHHVHLFWSSLWKSFIYDTFGYIPRAVFGGESIHWGRL